MKISWVYSLISAGLSSDIIECIRNGRIFIPEGIITPEIGKSDMYHTYIPVHQGRTDSPWKTYHRTRRIIIFDITIQVSVRLCRTGKISLYIDKKC